MAWQVGSFRHQNAPCFIVLATPFAHSPLFPNRTWLFSSCAPGVTHKKTRFCQGRIWVDLDCLKIQKKTILCVFCDTLVQKIVQMTLGWPNGRNSFFSHSRKAPRAKDFPFSPRADRCRLLRIGGKNIFQMMGCFLRYAKIVPKWNLHGQ